MKSGAGGATRAFQYAGGRRMDEIERVLGSRPVPGSLNLRLDDPFDWDAEYFRAQILDVKDRSRGIESEWGPRWARFYPVRVDGEDAFALRFESEHYDLQFMELIAPRKLRDMVHGPAVRVERC
jgi:CTP-dependent riboflavin kinase